MEDGSDAFNKSQDLDSSQHSSPRRVRFGSPSSLDSDNEDQLNGSDHFSIFSHPQDTILFNITDGDDIDKTTKIQQRDDSVSKPNNDFRVKEGVMLAKIRALEISSYNNHTFPNILFIY